MDQDSTGKLETIMFCYLKHQIKAKVVIQAKTVAMQAAAYNNTTYARHQICKSEHSKGHLCVSYIQLHRCLSDQRINWLGQRYGNRSSKPFRKLAARLCSCVYRSLLAASGTLLTHVKAAVCIKILVNSLSESPLGAFS